MKSLWASWPLIKRRILSKKKVLLLLDFDGTLAPIARTPQAVALDPKTRGVLGRLGRSGSYRVAILSGRSLKNLRFHIDLPHLTTVGNHGLEMRGKGLALPARARKARKLESRVRLLGRKLRKNLGHVDGLYIEDKNYTLSIHYRNLPREYRPFFKRAIARFRKDHRHWPLVWKGGKKVWEIRPGLKWGKGDMALHLAKHSPGALPVVIGDDVTDEDMFRALRARGITIRVGRSKRSSAEFYVDSPKKVGIFLERMSRAKA